MPSSPVLACCSVGDFDPRSLVAVRKAFEAFTPVTFAQSWRTSPEPAFAGGAVRVGRRQQSLVVLAELDDADIFTRATDHNGAFWELGDTFEIFLRPVDQSAYVELHVTPNNLRLHLRFPSAEWLASTPAHEVFSSALRNPHAFRSETWIELQEHRWSVLAEIPASVVFDNDRPLDATEWLWSFSRYDYTRDRVEPVISSTSPHAMPSFHRQQEWGRMHFR